MRQKVKWWIVIVIIPLLIPAIQLSLETTKVSIQAQKHYARRAYLREREQTYAKDPEVDFKYGKKMFDIQPDQDCCGFFTSYLRSHKRESDKTIASRVMMKAAGCAEITQMPIADAKPAVQKDAQK